MKKLKNSLDRDRYIYIAESKDRFWSDCRTYIFVVIVLLCPLWLWYYTIDIRGYLKIMLPIDIYFTFFIILSYRDNIVKKKRYFQISKEGLIVPNYNYEVKWDEVKKISLSDFDNSIYGRVGYAYLTIRLNNGEKKMFSTDDSRNAYNPNQFISALKFFSGREDITNIENKYLYYYMGSNMFHNGFKKIQT